ncbi:nitrate reductase subunit beta [Streptomyces sp. NPDC029721]|uniref:nitrate reductase subunit beta n=1 Tax=Streptomyces sp. NPDC029721 TaxID=3157090 RepID=UPI003402780F
MRVMAQVAMVMNLDKCIGCHTCSVTCKQAWTNRQGTEYVWFNNVETLPGQGYPRRWEDQDKWKGGWERTRSGRLRLRAGGRLRKLGGIFANPHLPELGDYYQPWTYEYKNLTEAPAGEDLPTARPVSQLTGEPLDTIEWGPNWDDNLGGAPEHAVKDPVVEKIREEVGERIRFEFEQSFMFYLPRICEHCLNPACVSSCPSGAMYKREEDGIVLVDQDRCRGWRMCVTGCPYKKVYFNHRTGKAEKCTFCFPRVEVGMPTVCSETCVGRMRYLGVMLYDADRVAGAAAVADEHDLYPAQLECFLDPADPAVIAAARASGITDEWLDAARRSPVYDLIATYQVALPLHPEYRTMPMVWYVPPLSPVVEAVAATGSDGEDAGNLFGAIDALRIPVEYLAEILTAGDTRPVEAVLRRMAAMRAYMRRINLGEPADESVAAAVGLTGAEMEDMFRLLAVAKQEDRFVIPAAARPDADALAASHPLNEGCPVAGAEGGPSRVTLDISPTRRSS